MCELPSNISTMVGSGSTKCHCESQLLIHQFQMGKRASNTLKTAFNMWTLILTRPVDVYSTVCPGSSDPTKKIF